MPATRITKIFGAPAGPGHRPGADGLADYNATIGEILPKNLREQLQDVVAYIFPFSAHPDRMQSFLDQYLNFPDGEGLKGAPPVYFKPAAPFVLLEVANYGRLSSNIKNAGWFSQREIAFGMVVEWYARKGDDLKFLKYALIYPYVYVDSPLGISGGREIYGWSKAPIEIALLRERGGDKIPIPLAPLFEPPTEQLLLAANLSHSGDSPHRPRRREKFIEIRQSRYLQTASSALADALTAVPRAIGASLNVGWEALKFFLESREYAASQIGNLPKMLPQYRGMMTRYLPSWITQTSGHRAANHNPVGSETSIITLKQVREIYDDKRADHNQACYQGILESLMRIQSISDGGSLVDLTNPDPSAGIYVDLFADAGREPGPLALGTNYRVIDSAPDDNRGKGERPGSSRRVSARYRLTPLLPFWVKMDLQYGLADYQTWRTTWTDWTETNSPIITDKQRIKYVHLGAGAGQEIPAPINFPQVTMRIVPLAGRVDKIQSILNGYLNNTHTVSDREAPASYFEFSPVLFPEGSSAEGDAIVLGLLSNFQGMETGRGSTTYEDYEFSFAIPITWRDSKTGKSGAGLVPVYTFTGTEWNAITTGEVYGRWTLESTFTSPPFPHILPPSRSIAGVRINTQLFPDKDASEEVLDLPILEVGTPYAGLPLAPSNRNNQEIINWLRAIGFAVTMRSDSAKRRFYSIALKQVRDANDTQKADYQASVWLGRNFVSEDAEWLNSEIEFRIPKYRTVSIADELELRREDYRHDGHWPHAEKVYLVKPVSPPGGKSGAVMVSGRLEALSEDIGWWRIGKDGWRGPGFAPAG
jgi:hypothetical protein